MLKGLAHILQTERLLKACGIGNGKLRFTCKKPDTTTGFVYNRAVSELWLASMTYPNNVLFDIETLINEAQPRAILLLGDVQASLLDSYIEQKSVLRQTCTVTHFSSAQIDEVVALVDRYDVAIALNLFEHIPKQTGVRLLSRLRDVLAPQYCVCLPLPNNASSEQWTLTEMFSFALKKVSEYSTDNGKLALFKYNIDDYKSTPDWLNPNNWANPNMWDKYRW